MWKFPGDVLFTRPCTSRLFCLALEAAGDFDEIIISNDFQLPFTVLLLIRPSDIESRLLSSRDIVDAVRKLSKCASLVVKLG
jgi:hypothetical protein